MRGNENKFNVSIERSRCLPRLGVRAQGWGFSRLYFILHRSISSAHFHTHISCNVEFRTQCRKISPMVCSAQRVLFSVLASTASIHPVLGFVRAVYCSVNLPLNQRPERSICRALMMKEDGPWQAAELALTAYIYLAPMSDMYGVRSWESFIVVRQCQIVS